MMIFSRRGSSGRPTLPVRSLVGWLAVSLILACLPGDMSLKIKDYGRALLAPGQQAARVALAELYYWRGAWRHDGAAAKELIGLRDRVRRLEDENESLRFAAAQSESRELESAQPDMAQRFPWGDPPRLSNEDDLGRSPHGSIAAGSMERPAPLVSARAIETRVLGQQAQAMLCGAAILASEHAAELTSGSLAVDYEVALLDQGANVRLNVGEMALAGGRVWGKLVEIGPQTAVVRRLTATGYRGLVQIVDSIEGVMKPLARGIVEGIGETQCRIRMVDATAPVSVGDLVLADEEEGVTAAPLVYGRIARAELEAGAAHWRLWMAPAIAADLPRKLVVVQPVINRK
jgi:hypothetical protein